MCGVQNPPTFDSPAGAAFNESTDMLGRACGGRKITKCQEWLQVRAPRQVVGGKEIRMVVDHEKLETVLCRVCKG
ncbi:MAG: hypothetical protein AB7T38_02435 [Nitrospirales bacterium]